MTVALSLLNAVHQARLNTVPQQWSISFQEFEQVEMNEYEECVWCSGKKENITVT